MKKNNECTEPVTSYETDVIPDISSLFCQLIYVVIFPAFVTLKSRIPALSNAMLQHSLSTAKSSTSAPYIPSLLSKQPLISLPQNKRIPFSSQKPGS